MKFFEDVYSFAIVESVNIVSKNIIDIDLDVDYDFAFINSCTRDPPIYTSLTPQNPSPVPIPLFIDPLNPSHTQNFSSAPPHNLAHSNPTS